MHAPSVTNVQFLIFKDMNFSNNARLVGTNSCRNCPTPHLRHARGCFSFRPLCRSKSIDLEPIVATNGKSTKTKAAKRAALWRLYQVKVAAEDDPGKDSFEPHPALLRAVEKKLASRGEISDASIKIVRKSFDAR